MVLIAGETMIGNRLHSTHYEWLLAMVWTLKCTCKSFLLTKKESNAEQLKQKLKDRNVKKCLGSCRIEIYFIEDGLQHIIQFIS